jgi:hypothetical protein
MCRAGGTPAGSDPKRAHARLWLWETLTGGLPRQAPPTLLPDQPEFLPAHSRFAPRLPAPTVQRLHQHARRLLDTHGCRHEPLTWSPSIDGIELDGLPGPDPDAIDPRAAHNAIANQPTLANAASELGITLEHLHHVARRHPAEGNDPTAATAPPRVRFAALLGAEQLRELIDHGCSLRHIEASYGITRKTLRTELITHGIPIPPKNRRTVISPANSAARPSVHLSPTKAPPPRG